MECAIVLHVLFFSHALAEALRIPDLAFDEFAQHMNDEIVSQRAARTGGCLLQTMKTKKDAFTEGLRIPDLTSREFAQHMDDEELFVSQWERAQWMQGGIARLAEYLADYNLTEFQLVDWKNKVVNKTSLADRWVKPSPDKCLIFYHIGKSAGTSLGTWFDLRKLKMWRYYGRLDYGHLSNNKEPPLGRQGIQFHGADAYCGHWTPGFKDSYFTAHGETRTCSEWTVLRNPLERVTSNLFFSIPGKTNDQYIEIMKNPDDPQGDMFFNHMCRQFSGLTETWDRFDESYSSDWKSTCDVEKAKEALRRLNGVGFLEHYDQVLNSFESMFGIPIEANEHGPIINPTKHPGYKGLTPELQNVIKEANIADLELYFWAVSEFSGLFDTNVT